MNFVMQGINASWVWLGPLLLFCSGVALICLVWDVLAGANEEMFGSDPWKSGRGT